MKVKDESNLPPHISYNEYQSLLNEIENNEYHRYLNKKLIPYLKDRDKLLMEFIWELGGRISDIIGLKTRDIDFSRKIITLVVKKRHGLAIYLLQHGVSDKIIARRLGHSSAATTIKYYMVITPEIEREALKGILL